MNLKLKLSTEITDPVRIYNAGFFPYKIKMIHVILDYSEVAESRGSVFHWCIIKLVEYEQYFHLGLIRL